MNVGEIRNIPKIEPIILIEPRLIADHNCNMTVYDEIASLSDDDLLIAYRDYDREGDPIMDALAAAIERRNLQVGLPTE